MGAKTERDRKAFIEPQQLQLYLVLFKTKNQTYSRSEWRKLNLKNGLGLQHMFPTCTIEREGVLYHLIDLCPYIHLLDFLFVCQKIFEEQ